MEEVEQWIMRNPDNKAWSLAEQRWSIFVDKVFEAYGAKFHWPTRLAAAQCRAVGLSVDPKKAVVTVFAMYLMAAREPWIFKSEKAFRFQLVRRVRALSRYSISHSRGGRDGRHKQVQQELAPRVVDVIASWLVELLGGPGVYLANRRQAEEAQMRSERAALREAMLELRLTS